jgi:endonuclease YncB( thermonuclease family)
VQRHTPECFRGAFNKHSILLDECVTHHPWPGFGRVFFWWTMERDSRRSCPLQARALILGLLIALLTPSAWAQILMGRVVGVADGDTITVLDDQRVQHKIRLAGIDAPEKSQAFGQRSKAFLSSLVFSKPVVVETQKTDRYGRTVGKVLVGDRDANLALVVAGMAWHYKKYETEQSASDRMIYASAEQDARVARQGLWADPSAMPPWEWRAQKRSK